MRYPSKFRGQFVIWLTVFIVGTIATIFGLMEASTIVGDQGSELVYYSFTAAQPEGGFCETQTLGGTSHFAEPWTLLFSISTVALGVLGIVFSRRTTMVFLIMYGLLAAYGLSSALYHATLENGWYRVMDVTLGMLQSFIVIMLFKVLCLTRARAQGLESDTGLARLLPAVVLLFTFYPALVHVAGESSASPTIAWVTFDVLWGVVAVLLAGIYAQRKLWSMSAEGRWVFRLSWISVLACLGAYLCWGIDKFACSLVVGFLFLHGFWHLLMGLCLYLMITMCRFLCAYEHGYEPRLRRVPERGPVAMPVVEWEPVEGSQAQAGGGAGTRPG